MTTVPNSSQPQKSA